MTLRITIAELVAMARSHRKGRAADPIPVPWSEAKRLIREIFLLTDANIRAEMDVTRLEWNVKHLEAALDRKAQGVLFP